MTFQEAYLEIKKKFDNADAGTVADFAIEIYLTDEDCHGTMYAEVKGGKLAVKPFDYNDHNLHLNITKAALVSALGRSSLEKAIADGKAEVFGDVSKFADLKATIKKATAKKTTTAKKSAAKKSTAKKATAEKKTTTAAKKSAAKKVAAKTEVKAAPAAKAEVKATTAAKTTKKKN